MKACDPIGDQPTVGHLETVLVRGVGGRLVGLNQAPETVRLRLQEGMTLVGRKGYKNGDVELLGILESVQLGIKHSPEGVQVTDMGSENGNLLVRSRSAVAFLKHRKAFTQSGGVVGPELVIAPKLVFSEDLICLSQNQGGSGVRWWPLETGDIIDHLYATWQVVLDDG